MTAKPTVEELPNNCIGVQLPYEGRESDCGNYPPIPSNDIQEGEKEQTPEQIAQWVINNRYPKSENDKMNDFELYRILVDKIKLLLTNK